MIPCAFGTAPGPTCGADSSWTVSGSHGECSASVPACDEHAEHLADALTSIGVRYLLRPLRPDPPASPEVPAVVAPAAPPASWWARMRDRLTRRDPNEAA